MPVKVCFLNIRMVGKVHESLEVHTHKPQRKYKRLLLHRDRQCIN